MSQSSSDSELSGNENICYKGEKKQEWLDSVAALNNLHNVVYPKILEQNSVGGWKRVNPDFPIIRGFNLNELDPGHKAFGFVEREMKDLYIFPPRANREEKSALAVIETTAKFMKIMIARVKVHGVYETIVSESKEVSSKEYDSSVMLMKLTAKKCTGREKENLEADILARASGFQKSKSKFQASVQLFKDASRCLAEEEGVEFDEKFNKNEYLNFNVFEKTFLISDKNFGKYFQEQETLWSDFLSNFEENSITTSTPIKPRSENLSQKDKDAENNKKEVERLNKKVRLFKEICGETEIDLHVAPLEELQENLREITKLHQELREAMCDEHIQITERVREYVTSRKILIRGCRKNLRDPGNKG